MRGVEDQMLRLSVIALFVAACSGVLVASCGGASPQKMAAPAAKSPGAEGAQAPLAASPKEEIERLEQQIATDSATLKLTEPTEEQVLAAPTQAMGTKPAIEDPKCKPAKTPTCESSCTISDSICKNANSICEIAAGMNDSWARGKCAKANRTCEDSKGKCCGCQS